MKKMPQALQRSLLVPRGRLHCAHVAEENDLGAKNGVVVVLGYLSSVQTALTRTAGCDATYRFEKLATGRRLQIRTCGVAVTPHHMQGPPGTRRELLPVLAGR